MENGKKIIYFKANATLSFWFCASFFFLVGIHSLHLHLTLPRFMPSILFMLLIRMIINIIPLFDFSRPELSSKR